MRLSHGAIAAMKRQGRGTVINVSSLASKLPAPSAAVYCSSKAFLNLFTETLALEHREDNIRFVAVLPGYVRTDFFRDDEKSSRASGLTSWLSPEQVVRAAIKALRRRHIYAIPGLSYRFLNGLTRLLPRAVLRALVAGRKETL